MQKRNIHLQTEADFATQPGLHFMTKHKLQVVHLSVAECDYNIITCIMRPPVLRGQFGLSLRWPFDSGLTVGADWSLHRSLSLCDTASNIVYGKNNSFCCDSPKARNQHIIGM